jgi:hypothetical protein
MQYGAEEKIEFIQPGVFLGEELSGEEAERAARDFETTMDEAFAAHKDKVVMGEEGEFSHAVLWLLVNADDGSQLEIKLSHVKYPTLQKREVGIFVRDPLGVPASRYEYSLAKDDSHVARVDVVDVAKLIEPVGDFLTLTNNAAQRMVSTDYAIDQAKSNRDLEKSMGVNDQPVGQDEINKLRQLLVGSTSS